MILLHLYEIIWGRSDIIKVLVSWRRAFKLNISGLLYLVTL